jgi:hypothetical protein
MSSLARVRCGGAVYVLAAALSALDHVPKCAPLKEVMVYVGHTDLTTTNLYVKRLPQPNEGNPTDRLNAYLAQA